MLSREAQRAAAERRRRIRHRAEAGAVVDVLKKLPGLPTPPAWVLPDDRGNDDDGD